MNGFVRFPFLPARESAAALVRIGNLVEQCDRNIGENRPGTVADGSVFSLID